MGKEVQKPERLRLELNWKICVFSGLMLPILVGLGFWQLSRAEEKQNIQQLLEQRQGLPPISFSQYQQEKTTERDSLRFRRIQLEGEFDRQRYWLLENQVLAGRIGFHAIAPFKTVSGEVFLVNRGWIASTGYRDLPPELEIPDKKVKIVGELKVPSEHPLLQSSASNPVASWPRLIVSLDTEELGKEIQAQPESHMVLLDADSVGALEVSWQAINMRAEKHRGYALQWFSMALALAVLTLFANTNLATILFSSNKNERSSH